MPTMRYCTLAELTRAIPLPTLIQLSNDDHQATEPNMDVVGEAVRQAEERIDASLRGRYTLPLAAIPTMLRDLTISQARFWLYARRPEGADLPEAVKAMYKGSIDTLDLIRDGKLTLGLATGEEAPEPGVFKVRARPRRFASSAAFEQGDL